ncbi:3,4-dihydroxy-2-butanone 4-phosphate synthase family protein [Anaplasma phagocytophilum str. ApMUC09]|uniref:3,4-dihydroxy-2-butanone 4-phosphate synthase family protein n=1 Tax=Anaplasma phagocytophilum str. ApMUC09 TaxID=1359152 RepID=A0A0F3N772_ANAPH|nr:3,4-dihydroxy-2-butanone 4-phosphate synthase family protein [Anaplasma phagocytophilum str. ApMUC09]
MLQTAIALFSPIIPHVTHYISSNSETESPKWPLYEEIPRYEAIEQMCEEAMRIVHEIRRYKSENCIAMNHSLNRLSISSKTIKQAISPLILARGVKVATESTTKRLTKVHKMRKAETLSNLPTDIPSFFAYNVSKACWHQSFTPSINARYGITTGIQASDRAATILSCI